MKLRTILAVTALGAAGVPASLAQAQTPPDPISGGTVIGGVVSSFLELSVTQPTSAFTKFTKAKTYSASFKASATTTDDTALISIADGEVASGSKLGRLTSGSKKLPLALEARAGKGAFQRLDTSVAPLLARLSGPATRATSTISLRQKVQRKVSGSYRKLVLVTLSTEAP
jgi:hypothetical protein